MKIEMSGDERCREPCEAFTGPHARWRLIQSNRWGVALLPIPERFDDYLRDPNRSHRRRETSRASRAGFSFAPIDPLARLDENLAISID